MIGVEKMIFADLEPSEKQFEPGGLCGLFETQVERTPAAPAVKVGDKTITYRELNSAANRLARRLVDRGVKREDAVGICLKRSGEMIVAVLATLKAGGAYVPLDPAYPGERLRLMVEDSRPRVLLTQRELDSSLAEAAAETMYLDDVWNSPEKELIGNPACAAEADSLAYLMYTSGSTGRPKAVAMEHGPLCNLLQWQVKAFPTPARTLQFASLSFDVSFQEIFSTLVTGGLLVLLTKETQRDAGALIDFIEAQEIERLFVPFVALQQLAAVAEARDCFPARLRDVITAGEQLLITPQIRHFFARLRHCVLHNHYGPTESHVATAHTLGVDPAQWPDVAPIGRPIDGVSIHLLDQAMQAVPAGEVGEIYIGGRCLARGYLHNAEFTAARFLRDPFGVDERARLYRSGDRALAREDGLLEFVGRNDEQLKIRGVRVEPGEVEAALLQHPAIQHAAIKCFTDPMQTHRLVAYYVAREHQTLKREELRTFLSKKLMPASVPSAFVELDRMPFTATGKLDRLSLPMPALKRDEPAFPPRNKIEKELVAIWEAVFDVHAIGIRDDFLELGGDSLLAARIAVAIEKEIQIPVPVGKLYEFSTIESLARHLTHGPKTNDRHDFVILNAAGAMPPLFSVLGSLNMGRHLNLDRPFVQLLASAFLPGPFMKVPLSRTSGLSTAITELAAHCITGIKAIQPRGPYFLSGYSVGAIISFEIARQLDSQGEKIAFLALLDPDPPRPSRIDFLRREIHRIGPVQALREQLGRVRARAGRVFPSLSRQTSPSPNAASSCEMPPNEWISLVPNLYPAAACPCRLTLFLAEDHYSDRPRNPSQDPRLDWRKTAVHGCDVHTIPGDHFTMNEEPNARAAADILRSCLAKTTLLTTMIPSAAAQFVDLLVA